MSLDVYLRLPGAAPRPSSGIFVREGGVTREMTRDEWDARYPGREPYVVPASDEADTTVYDANITHNLSQMADAAGIYKALWRPEELGITTAHQLTEQLRTGLAALLAEPEKFEALNPPNGWGDYDGLVEFVSGYLAACAEYPDAAVSVSR